MLILGLTGDIACGKSTVASMLAARGATLLDADLLVRELYADRDFASLVAALFDTDSLHPDSLETQVTAPVTAAPHEYSCSAPTAAPMKKEGAHDVLSQVQHAQVQHAQVQASQTQVAKSRFLAADGTVDRAALGHLVFSDASALKRLEALVHPAVAALRDARIADLKERSSPPRAVVLEAVKLIESGQARICDQVWWVVCDPEVQLRRLISNRGMREQEARARLAQQPDRGGKRAGLGAVSCALIENNRGLAELEKEVEREWRRALEKTR